MHLPVRLLTTTARMPTRAHDDDAAFDLHADEALTLAPGQRTAVRTGLALSLTPATAGLVLPRSGLAAKHGITVLNAPGLIDPGYRGEIMAILLNTDSSQPFQVRLGDRIAQLLIIDLLAVTMTSVDGDLQTTARGANGFGSTGR